MSCPAVPFLVVLLVVFSHVSSEPVNVALDKAIDAQYTCGLYGSETYYDHSDTQKPPSSRTKQQCPDTNRHPVTALVDGSTDTKWQSTSRINIYTEGKSLQANGEKDLEAVIKIDLLQEFSVERIKLILGDALRPGRLAVLKSNDDQVYVPWAYKVTEQGECNDFSSAFKPLPENSADTVCTTYTPPVPVAFEEIEFDFSQVNTELREWRTARYLQFKFYKMPLTFNIAGVSYQHYAISELQVMAECICNGHQTDCKQNNETKEFECICGGNTKGSNCEMCSTFFNQKPFQYQIPCETCNCQQHATECYYDELVAEQKKSLDENNKKNGGGICVNCIDHTSGLNCEKCSPNYYRPLEKQQTDKEACVPCDCSLSGSDKNPESGLFADCVMNNDIPLPFEQAPGDCFCKKNVMGTKCSQCKDEYFNLRADNPDGCEPCDCNVAGTINGNKSCSSDATGICNCKQNVENRQCDVCKDEFYNLNTNNALGCTPCGCNVGGSTTLTCDKTFGHCTCRPNIESDTKKCDKPKKGKYYPDVHFISAEFESGSGDASLTRAPQFAGYSGYGYADLKSGNLVGVNLVIPGGSQLSGDFIIVIHYRNTAAGTGQLDIKPSGGSPVSINFPVCSTSWCYVNTKDTRLFKLTPAVYTVTIRIQGDMFLDQIVAVPTEFVDPKSNLVDASFKTVCNVLENNIGTGAEVQTLCKASIFSMTAYYLNGARDCDCDTDGTLVADGTLVECEEYSGQCRCKPGVGGRKCDECLPGFYDHSITGCKACDCKGTNEVCDKSTGQCVCPPNTIGRGCDQCAVYHWNWKPDAGCEPCGCDKIGSISEGCDQSKGTCTCKIGVEGDKCSQCKDDYKGFGVNGCSSCLCSTIGSNSTICNKESGQCSCKDNAGELLCDQCSPTSFYLNEKNDKGCLDCICMGITRSCSVSSQRLTRVSTLLTTNLGGELKASIKLGNNQGVVSANTVNVISGSTIYLSVTQQGTSPEYWMAPDDLKGNLLSLYGTTIDLDIQFTSTGSGQAIPVEAIMVGKKGRFVHKFTAPTAGSKQSLSVKFDEKSWLKDGTGVLTRGEFVLAINDISYVLLPASFLNGPHTSECAPGYRRDAVSEHDYLGMCIPCECNSHTSQCDPDTGECINCQHHTTGSKCELCMAGYYGDASLGTPSDCNECTCYLPRVVNSTCELESGNIKCSYCNPGYVGNQCDECDVFYYGNPHILKTGTCTGCDCNGNTDSCDKVSGRCIDCKGQTIGDHCERCQDGYFGNATAQNCAACECNSQGSTQSVCDYSTGQCSCYAGVGERQCSRCKTGFWGYQDGSTLGCIACECIEAGSTTLQCNDNNGQCTCKDNVNGDKCESCNDGYFGLPNQPCEVCNCSAVGTIGGTDKCDKVSGQCTCKDGVSGRQCNECMKFYSGFSETGCTKCGACEASLGNDTLKQTGRFEELWKGTQQVSQIQDEDTILQQLQLQLNQTLSNLGISDDNSLDQITANLSTLQTQCNAEVENLMTQASDLKTLTVNYKTNSNNADEKVVTMVTDGNLVLRTASNVKQKASNYDLTLSTWNTTAAQLMNQGAVGENINLNFDSQVKQGEKVLETIRSPGGVSSMDTKVTTQSTLIDNLKIESTTADTNMKDGAKSILDKEEQLATLLAQETGVRTAQNTARTHKTQIESNVAETTKLVDKAENETTTGQSDIASGKSSVTKHDAIYSGTAASVLSADILPLPEGYTNFLVGAETLRNALDPAKVSADSVNPTVGAVEVKAQSLQNAAEQLQKTFDEVKGRGDNAVAAIQNYEKVKPVLDDSLALSKTANTTITETRSVLAGITVMNLETLANVSKLESEQLRTEFSSLSYAPEVLKTRVESSKASLTETITDWNKVDGLITQMTTSATQLQTLANGNTVNQVISAGDVSVGKADELITRLTSANDAHVTNLNTRESEINSLKSLATQGNQLITDTEQLLVNHNGRVDTVNRQIEHTNGLKTETAALRESLQSKLDNVKTKIATALNKLKQLKQPIHFNGTTSISVTNPITKIDQNYNDLSFEFRKESGFLNGLLFFTENPAAGSELSVELVNGKVTFDYDTNLDPVTIENPAIICDGCWARVIASRYSNTGHLTVHVLSSGGKATVAKEGKSSSQNLLLDSPLLFGGLPSSYQTNKVRSRNFLGCIQKINFNDQDINLWQEAISQNWEPSCCRQPLDSTPNRMSPGVSFDGSGYLLLSQETLNLAARTSLYLTIKFRTFNPNAAILLVISSDKTTKYGLYLQDGHVVFEYGNTINSNNMFKAKSQQKYNTGVWVQIIAQYTSNQFNLETKIVDQTPSTPSSDQVVRGTVSVSLTALTGQDIIIGTNKNPNDVDYTSGVNSFSGCLKDLQFGSSVSSLTELSLSENPVKLIGVSTTGCFTTVLSGMRFTTTTSTVNLNVGSPQLASFQQLQFDLITSYHKGILFYVQEAVTGIRKLYIGLFHGNVIVIYQENNQQLYTITTTGLFLSDDKQHSIKLELSTKARLIVDGTVFESSQSLISSTLTFTNTPTVYLGGIAESITLPAGYPARISLVGSIRNFMINNQEIDPFTSGVIVKQSGLDLGGVLTPSSFVPPLLFTTTVPPITAAPATCAPSTEIAYLSSADGVWFNGVANENLNYDNVPVDLFKSSFVVSITFQSFSSSGVLFYMADANINPKEWILVYLNDGYIHISFSGKEEATGGFTEKYNINSDNQYNDGKQYKVDILRVNNFLAFVETTRKDYANNNIASTKATTLNIGTNVYIGGINPTIDKASFPIKDNLLYVGAIYKTEMTMDSTSHLFNLRGASGQEADSLIYKNGVYGVSLSGDRSYIKPEYELQQGKELSFKVGFRTNQDTANLVTVYKSSGEFVVADLVKGQIRVLIASSTSGGHSFISVSKQVINFCDNARHDVTIAIGEFGVGIQVDTNLNQVFPYPPGLEPPKLQNVSVYIGGLEDPSLVFPDDVSKDSLRGCIETFVIQGTTIDLLQVKTSAGVTIACPT